MAFSRSEMARVSSSGNTSAPALWSYNTEDTGATVNTEGYFNDMAGELKVGDLIYVVSETGGTRVSTLNQVLTNSAGVVDVADGTILAATDGD